MQKVHKTTFKVDKVKPGSAKLKPFHDAHDRFRGLLDKGLCFPDIPASEDVRFLCFYIYFLNNSIEICARIQAHRFGLRQPLNRVNRWSTQDQQKTNF